MSQTIGRVLYDDLTRRSAQSYVYSGTEISGFEVANAFDLRDWSLFRSETGPVSQTITVTMGESATLDHWFAYWVDPVQAGVYDLQLEVDTGGGFVVADSFDPAAVDRNMRMRPVGPYALVAGNEYRYTITTPASGFIDIRSLMAGPEYQFPIGQHVGIRPPALYQQVIRKNLIATDGTMLGASVRRTNRRSAIELEYLTEAQVRGGWQDFQRHAARRAFAYSWDEARYPDEAVFASALSIEEMENTTPTPTMRVSMPLTCKAE